MAIPVQCPECHKRYQAPDHMAGKRVKCKYCGVVFLIAADARSADEGMDLSALDELNSLHESGKHAAARPAGATAAGGGIDDLFGGGDFTEPGAPRTNKLYVFPMSRLLDHWLPPVLLAIGVLWAVREAFLKNDTGRGWVGFVRAALFLLAFFASLFPFMLAGIRAAGRRENYELPPKPGLRILGAYAVPFALTCAMWLIYKDVRGLMFGFALGAVVALPVVFLLFRLLPKEAPVTFGYTTGAFLLSTVVSVAAAFAINLMVVGILRSVKTEYTMLQSPLGPGLQWDVPPQPKAERVAHNRPPPDESDGAGREGPTTAQGTTVPTTATTRVAVPATRGSPDAVVLTGPLTRPAGPGSRDVMPTGPGGTSGPGGTAANADNGGRDGAVANPGARSTGAAAEVRAVVPGNIAQLVHPLVPAPWIAVVREGPAGHDRVERWNTETWTNAGTANIPLDPAGNRYALSPDGQFLAYISDFPKLAVQVWSFEAGKMARQLPLDRDSGNPFLLGFTTPDQLVVQWRRGGETALHVYGIKGNSRPRSIPVTDFEPSANLFAVSPDGQSIAVVIRGGSGADLESYSLATGRPVKQMPITELDWTDDKRIVGVAFSPDGGQIAAVFAGARGAGLYVAWPAVGRAGRAVAQNLIPSGMDAPLGPDGFTPAFQGRAIHWLDKGNLWLLYGRTVHDTKTGEKLYDVGLPGVRAQYAAGGDACELLRVDELGDVRIDAVRFNVEKLRTGEAGRTPARG